MGSLVNKVTDTLGLTDSGSAARATSAGYSTMSAAQREALDYLKEVDAMPREFRDKALGAFADVYGMGESGAEGRQEFFSGLEEDPLYGMVMDTMDDREEAYLRTQGATGNLRGGESIRGVGDIAADTKKEAIMTAYQDQLSGIQGLMGLPTHEKDIYEGMIGIGDTEGRGKIAVGQAEQAAEQSGWDNAFGIGKMIAGFV